MKEISKQLIKKQKGITLIALIITVVVMLILAGVAISAIVNSSLFDKTRQSAQIYENAAKDESSWLSDLLGYIDMENSDIKLSYKTENIDEYSTKIDLKTEILNELLTEISTSISYEEYAQKILGKITTNEEKEIMLVEGSNYIMEANYSSIDDIYNETGCNSLEELSQMMKYNSVDEMLIGMRFVKPQGYDFENNCTKHNLYINGVLQNDFGIDTLDSYIYIASGNGNYTFNVVVGDASQSITVNIAGLQKIEYSYIDSSYDGGLYAIDTLGNLYQFDIEMSETNYTNTHIQLKRISSNVKVKEILAYDHVYGQDNKIYKYDSISNTFVLQLDGMEFTKKTNSSYLFNESGEVYYVNSDKYGGIQKVDYYGNLRFKDLQRELGLTVDNEVYELEDITKISGELKVKEIDNYDSFITEDGDLYVYNDYSKTINKINDESVKFKQFYYDSSYTYRVSYDYIMAENGDLYKYDSMSVTSIDININDVKSICDDTLILNDGSIYIADSKYKEFENIVNDRNIEVKLVRKESKQIIDEENNVYIWHNPELIKLDIKGIDIIATGAFVSYVLVGTDNKAYNVDCSGEDIVVNLITDEAGSCFTDLATVSDYLGCTWINENNEICFANVSSKPM